MPTILCVESRASLAPWHRPEAHPAAELIDAKLIQAQSIRWRGGNWQQFLPDPVDRNHLCIAGSPTQTLEEVHATPPPG
jgi:hypothetical protein